MHPIRSIRPFHAACLLAVAALVLVPGARADDEVVLQVRSTRDVPIEHAEVAPLAGGRAGASVFTDADGRVALPCAPPCTVLVRHPRFVEQAVTVAAESAGEADVEAVLEAKQAVFERIDVTAERSRSGAFRAATVASTEVDVDDKAASPSSLVELVEGVAGVAENGQPGLFQVYAIRGVSRHRVLTFVDGVQIMGERRAGVATNFVDPLLMGSVDVLRGPSSTYYGSGALGGVVQIFPRFYEGLRAETGWDEFGDETWQMVGWGDGAEGEEQGWSVGVVRRNASNDRVSSGELQNTGFTQTSASLLRTWRSGGRDWEVLVMPSLGDEIGKPNTDFPEDRITNYLREEHLLFKVAVADDDGWQADVWAHPNSLETEVTRPGESLSTVENEAFDLGGDFQWLWKGRNGVTGRLGVDYFARRGVEAVETARPIAGGEPGEASAPVRTLDGDEDQVAAFGSLRFSLGATEIEAGSRFTWIRQENDPRSADDAGADLALDTSLDQSSLNDTAWTGFVGLLRPVGGGFELTANVGTGLRFANLSERFFVGTTGRGQVIGNPDLEPEESLSVDAGVRFYGSRSFASVQAFRLEIDDYIERIRVADGTRTFVNLTSGRIRGLEVEGFVELAPGWLLDGAGHLLDGEADDGSPLADVSQNRVRLGLEYEADRWRGRLRWQHRFEKDDAGPSEVPLDAADLVAASVSYEIGPRFTVTLRGDNLLDETYTASADDQASPAPGRSVGVGLAFTRP